MCLNWCWPPLRRGRTPGDKAGEDPSTHAQRYNHNRSWLHNDTETFIVSSIKAVVAAQLFASLNMLERDNPERLRSVFHRTVGITGMIDIAGGIGQRLPVNVILFVEVHDVHIVLG